MARWDLPAIPALAPGAGNLTGHLRKLEDAGLLVVTKVFQDLKPGRWSKVTLAGRRARPHDSQRSTATATAPGRSCTSRQMTGNGEPTGTALRTFKPRVDDGTADRAVFE